MTIPCPQCGHHALETDFVRDLCGTCRRWYRLEPIGPNLVARVTHSSIGEYKVATILDGLERAHVCYFTHAPTPEEVRETALYVASLAEAGVLSCLGPR